MTWMRAPELPVLSRDERVWERTWAPYDQATYQSVLAYIKKVDIVLEIGAGDLRLARQIAQVASQVIAVEIQEDLLEQGTLTKNKPPPDNLTVVKGDALSIPFPTGITVAVLLMRHCLHFQAYAEKLRKVGCNRVITNARWRMGVEQVNLNSERVPYEDVKIGWYTCWCGSAGFKPGLADEYTAEVDNLNHEVIGCPHCCQRES